MYLQGKRMFTFPVFRYPTIISDYLIRMSVSEPISIALNISERKRVEKNNLAHTCVYNKTISFLLVYLKKYLPFPFLPSTPSQSLECLADRAPTISLA